MEAIDVISYYGYMTGMGFAIGIIWTFIIGWIKY